MNSTVGLGGFFDPASKMGIPRHGEDFGQTLAVWGVGEGPYLMLPLLGPSNPRDAAGLAVDAVIDPTNQIRFKQHIWWSAGREYFTLLDLTRPNLPNHPGHPAQFGGLLFIPAQPLPPAAQRTDPQWPQGQ